MKKLIIWLAKAFNVIITKEVIVEKEIEKIVYKDKIVEVPLEVIKEIIKEVEVIKEIEVPVYKDIKYVALKDEVTNDTYVEGNLIVKSNLYVNGEVTCHKIKGE